MDTAPDLRDFIDELADFYEAAYWEWQGVLRKLHFKPRAL